MVQEDLLHAAEFGFRAPLPPGLSSEPTEAADGGGALRVGEPEVCTRCGAGLSPAPTKRGKQRKKLTCCPDCSEPTTRGSFWPPSHPVQQGQSLGCSPEG